MLYSAKTDRAKRGKQFQEEVFNFMVESKLNVKSTWDYYKNKNLEYTNVDLAKIEQKEGDILLFDNNENVTLHFEVFTLLDEKGIFPVFKTTKYYGDNKYYIVKLLSTNEIYLMPSRSWNGYAKKLKKINIHGKDFYSYKISYIQNFRNKIKIDFTNNDIKKIVSSL
jgi:hypothetical protein